MIDYKLNSPDSDALNRLLSEEYYSTCGMILRLAWYLGLMRGEIRNLGWSQVDFVNAVLRLPDRVVPIPQYMISYLADWKKNLGKGMEYVITSQNGKPFAEQYISKLARQALDHAGQAQVRLIDLRHDFIVRQLQKYNWQYVSQISGIGAVSLKHHFLPYTDSTNQRRLPNDLNTSIEIKQDTIAGLIKSKRFTPAATLVCLANWVGLQVNEMQDLKWDQLDLSLAMIQLPARTVPIPENALQYLTALKIHENGHSDYVVASKRSGKRLEAAYISKTARSALISTGIHNITLSDLRCDFLRRTQIEPPILSLVQKRNGVTRADIVEAFGITRAQAHSRLNRMVASGKLVRVGNRYFLTEQTTSPERHDELIMEYLRRENSAVRQDFARLLHILPRQVYPILRKLIETRKITYQDGRYYLVK